MLPKNLRLGLKAVFGLLFVFVVLFVPAGTLYWSDDWLLSILLFGYALAAGYWLQKHNPELLEDRMATKMPKKSWDKLIMGLLFVSVIGLVVVAGIDFRLKLTFVPLVWKVVGFVGFSIALIFNFWAMNENKFASRIVEIQPEKNQGVISTGTYAIVRHPMYIAFSVMFCCLALALGSFYALFAGFSTVLVLIARTSLEDKLLQKELPGYKEYSQKTRYKLLPGVW